jgi:hypothetical protein
MSKEFDVWGYGNNQIKDATGNSPCLQARDERRRFLTLFSLAFGNVSTDGFGANLPCSTAVISAGPKLFFAGALCKRRELLPCNARVVTFEQANNLGGGIFRWSTDEAMHMINICFQREQCEARQKYYEAKTGYYEN